MKYLGHLFHFKLSCVHLLTSRNISLIEIIKEITLVMAFQDQNIVNKMKMIS